MYNNTLSNSLCMGCMEPMEPNTRTCPNCGYFAGQEAVSEEFINPGTIIYDRYLVGKVLNSDKHGVLYIAYDTALDSKAILHCVIPEKNAGQFADAMSDKSTLLDAVKKRSSDLKDIRGLLTFYEAFTTQQELYTVRRYTDTVTLKEYVDEHGGRVPYRIAVKLLRKAAGIVHKMHQRGVMHCGISPDNILVGNNGEVFVIDEDFVTQDFSDNPELFLRNGFAPLELYDNETATPATDVYSFAACLYYAIMGRPLPPAMDRKAGYDCPAPSVEGVKMPGTTQQVMIDALHLDPNRRIQALDELFILLKDADPTQSSSAPSSSSSSSASPAPAAKAATKAAAKSTAESDEDAEGEPRFSLPGYFKYIVLGVASALLIFVCLVVAGVFDKGENKLEVPNVTGYSVAEADTILAEAGFDMLVVEAQDSTELPGIVIMQDQAPESKQPEGDFITVTVSSGTTVPGTLPNVQYRKLTDAFTTLKNEGFNVTIKYSESDNVIVGNVISQNIESGTISDLVTDVELEVSTGSVTVNSKLVNSQTVTEYPATVAFISEGYVWDVLRTVNGSALNAMPTNPTPSSTDGVLFLTFTGWYTLENGAGSMFNAQSVCSGAFSVYANFSDGNINAPEETIDPSAEVTIEPTVDPLLTETVSPEPTVMPTTVAPTEPAPTEPPVVTEPPAEPTDEPVQTEEPVKTEAPEETTPTEEETDA